jgi:hypothetical protein
MALPSYIPFSPDPIVQAQNDPPPFGMGDWVINTPTLISDQSLTIRGRVLINSGGSLTLDHSVLIIMSPTPYQYNLTAFNGSAINILNGSFVGGGDTSTAFQVAPLSKLVVRNSTISNFGGVVTSAFGVVLDNSSLLGNGDSTGIGLGVMGGSATIRHTNMSGSTKGIWMDMGNLNIIDSTFMDNSIGIYMMYNYDKCVLGGYYSWPPWTPDWVKNPTPSPCGDVRFTTIERTDFKRNAGVGIWVEVSNLFMTNSHVLWTSGEAVYGMSYYKIDIENSEISHDEGVGIQLMKGGTSVVLKNVNITDCRGYTYLADENVGGIDWSTDSDMRIEGNIKGNSVIHAEAGGHLTMDSTKIETPGFYRTSVIADAGGIVEILNSTIGAAGQSAKVSSVDGGLLLIHNSTLSGAGRILASAGDLLFDNSTLMNSPNGIIVDGGQTIVSNSLIFNCSLGLQANAGSVELLDTNIVGSSNKAIYLVDGQVDSYDTYFSNVLAAPATGVLQVFWSSQVRSMWENGAPLGNATVNISELDGTPVWSGASGQDGLTPRTYLRQYQLNSIGTTVTTPHRIAARFKSMSNSTTGLVEGPTVLPVYIEDSVLPVIKVTYPGLDIHKKNGTLFVNGTARDNESGLDRIQWSLDEDLWTDAEGLGKWNFTTNLSVGSRELYVRALDRAGNIANVTMHVTIDNTPPYVYILSPNNNFTTKLLNVLVLGATETGTTVTIKNQSVVSVDGTFRMSVPIVEGPNVLVVTVKDASGNTNSTSVRVIRRTIPPKINITYPPDNYFTNKVQDLNLPVTGFTDPGAKLMSQDRLVNVNDDGSFSFTYGLKEGLNEIYLLAEDSLGNQNSSVRHVTYDITKPSLNITSPADGLYTNQSSVTISGTTKAMATVTARSLTFSASTQADPYGKFDMKIGLSEGPNIIQLMARDRANNTKTGTLTVTKDTVAPILKVNGVKDGMVSDKVSLIVEGQTEVGAHIKLNGEIIPVGVTGNFGTTLNLTSANNTFVFEATDKAGNTNAMTLHIKRKAPTEPKPTGTAAALDYMLWFAVLATIILIVQWAFIARSSQLKAKKKVLDKTSPEEPKKAEINAPRTDQRMMPRRPRRNAPVVVEQGAPEFEIEYGSSNEMGPGGGRR